MIEAHSQKGIKEMARTYRVGRVAAPIVGAIIGVAIAWVLGVGPFED